MYVAAQFIRPIFKKFDRKTNVPNINFNLVSGRKWEINIGSSYQEQNAYLLTVS